MNIDKLDRHNSQVHGLIYSVSNMLKNKTIQKLNKIKIINDD